MFSLDHGMRFPARGAVLIGLASLIAAGAVVVGAAGADCGTIDPLTVLADGAACRGWAPDGAPLGAYTLPELMVIIDGGAFLYDRHGFVAAGFQNYQGPDAIYATLSLFNQGLPDSALALYNDPESGEGEPLGSWSGSGPARISVAFGITRLQFQEACFFGSITVIGDSEVAVQGAECVAGAAALYIRDAVPVREQTWGRIKHGYTPAP